MLSAEKMLKFKWNKSSELIKYSYVLRSSKSCVARKRKKYCKTSFNWQDYIIFKDPISYYQHRSALNKCVKNVNIDNLKISRMWWLRFRLFIWNVKGDSPTALILLNESRAHRVSMPKPRDDFVPEIRGDLKISQKSFSWFNQTWFHSVTCWETSWVLYGCFVAIF